MTGVMGLRAVVVAALLTTSAITTSSLGLGPSEHIAEAAELPNIVVILTDDQPTGTMAAMPAVTSLIGDQGATFTQGVIPTSLCCPSRASLLSGDFAHTTGVYTNQSGPIGGWEAFRDDESQTLATALDGAGYRTGLFGKYMNGYVRHGWQASQQASIPAGWDEFVVVAPHGRGDGTYYDYDLVGTQQLGPFGTAEADYSTDVTAGLAVDFVQTSPADAPLFLMWAPYGPHGPVTPAPRHAGLWADAPITLPEGVNEADMTDKPAWLADTPRVNEDRLISLARSREETLMSIDEGVAQIVEALGPEASNTLFVFLSDNGMMQGIHRLTTKHMPYRASTDVPLLMRWDSVIPAGSTQARITPNIDVTATIAEAAGVGWPMDGKSALSTTRTGVFLEAMRTTTTDDRPPYCGYRNDRFLYVRYGSRQGTELYDYRHDPAELNNVSGRAAYQTMEQRLRRLTKKWCDPPPPEFTWR